MTRATPSPPRPLNQPAAAHADLPAYPRATLGNPASTLMESGVGNCFPGLEFDLRQLDVRFFPGLVFAFPGVTPAGPDGTQGARLVLADASQDPVFDDPHAGGWIAALRAQLDGPEGAALASGDWYLHWVQQYGQRIELYHHAIWQNALTRTPYEGEVAWWIVRLIEADPDPDTADLTIALTQRDASGQPAGHPVVLRGKRRVFRDAEGMIPPVYRAGELTASMCSPWTHDFRDCACQYWASNHPDVALGAVDDPNALVEYDEATDDGGQPVTFLDWMRRRGGTDDHVSAAPTIEGARPARYDPYEINLHWQELDFVLQGQETDATPPPMTREVAEPYPGFDELVADLANNLARIEFTLSMEYLYAYFSLRAPDEISPEEAAAWPGLANDLRAARQLILSVAISEMTHLRWINQTLWLLARARPDSGYRYTPVVAAGDHVPDPDGQGGEVPRAPLLAPAHLDTIRRFVAVERPGGAIDTEYAALVDWLRREPGIWPVGLYQLAVRIDSDGLNHYHKFCEVLRILTPYAQAGVALRDVTLAAPDAPQVQGVLDLLDDIVGDLRKGYAAEAASISDNAALAPAARGITAARDKMHMLSDAAEALARQGIGVPFFARSADHAARAGRVGDPDHG